MEKVKVLLRPGVSKVRSPVRPDAYLGGTVRLLDAHEAALLVASGDASYVDEVPSEKRIEATEAAIEKARALGVELSEVSGSGTGGRITVGDVENHHYGGSE